MLGNNIESVQIEMLEDFRERERIFSPVGVFDSEEGIDFIVDLVSEKEVRSEENFVSNTIGDHASKSTFVVLDDSAVVPGTLCIVLVEIDSESVVGVAMLTEVASSESETGVEESLVGVESSVKIPFFVPSGNNTIVEMQFQVVSRLDLGEEGSALGKVEPEFEFVGEFKS